MSVDDRLRALERTNARLVVYLAASVILLTGVLVGQGCAATGERAFASIDTERDLDVVRARRLMLIDAEGRTRGVWGTTRNGAATLEMLDREGKSVCSLSMSDDGASILSLRGPGNPDGVTLGCVDSSASLLLKAGGQQRCFLSADDDGVAELRLNGDDGVARSSVVVRPDGAATFALADRERRSRLSIESTADGHRYGLCLFSEAGEMIGALGTTVGTDGAMLSLGSTQSGSTIGMISTDFSNKGSDDPRIMIVRRNNVVWQVP